MNKARKSGDRSAMKELKSIASTTPSQAINGSIAGLDNQKNSKDMNQANRLSSPAIKEPLNKNTQSKSGSEKNKSKSKKVRGRKLELDKKHLRKNLIFWGADPESRAMPYKILRTKGCSYELM